MIYFVIILRNIRAYTAWCVSIIVDRFLWRRLLVAARWSPFILTLITGQNDSRSCERVMTSRQCLLVVQISRDMKERKETVNRDCGVRISLWWRIAL